MQLRPEEISKIIKDQIKLLISQYEPRVSLQAVDVYHKSQEDADKGIVTVVITYSTLELGTETATFHIERVR